MCNNGRVMAKKVIFNMAAAPSWILSDMSSEGKSCPGTLFYILVFNLVQIHSKMVELLPFNGFQNGGWIFALCEF